MGRAGGAGLAWTGGGGTDQPLRIDVRGMKWILDGTPLIAPGTDGMGSVELANVLHYSSLINQTIELPMDAAAWEKKLNQLIAESRHEKKVVQSTVEDFTKSFNR